VLIFNFYKRLIFNLRGQELITCSQILNRTLTMCSDKTLNYDCAQCRISTTLPPQMLPGAPLMVIYKKKVLLCYISRPHGLKEKYSNWRYNFGRTRPV